MAPEIVEKKEYSGPPADIWASGVLLYALLCGNFPYKGSTDEELYARICACSPRLPDHLSISAKEFLKVIFTYNPEIRPNAFDILHEQWLNPTSFSSSNDDSTIEIKRGKATLLLKDP